MMLPHGSWQPILDDVSDEQRWDCIKPGQRFNLWGYIRCEYGIHKREVPGHVIRQIEKAYRKMRANICRYAR